MDEDNLNNQGTEEQASDTQTSETQEEKGSRMDAAKAWFRQMNAGAEAGAGDVDISAQGGGPAARGGGQSSGPCRNCQGLEFQVKEAEQKATEAESLYK